MSPACNHDKFAAGPSKYAPIAGYKVRTARQRVNATLGTSVRVDETAPAASTFPAPLILPWDELSYDPSYDEQSVQEWIDEKHCDRATKQRRKIYLVPAPTVSDRVSHVSEWARPKLSKKPVRDPSLDDFELEDLLEYLQAFYHGLDVKLWTKSKLEFVRWKSESNGKGEAQCVGLNIGSEVIRISARPSKDGLFKGQLNLNDMLDAAIAMLPKDAYALLMVVDHDLFEDEEDDFCCGRAYGGSRVAVVSKARYCPQLDAAQNTQTSHPWPISHCAAFMKAECDDALSRETKKVKRTPAAPSSIKIEADTAMTNATRAWLSAPADTHKTRSDVWLGRVCKTASHELGHCVGIDHCVYYACIMQGTASLSEDQRQPPYLCPVDMVKVLATTRASMTDHYQALLRFCKRFEGRDGMFTAYAAWLRFRLREICPADDAETVSVISLSSD